jgi:murein DD-endopeptidase MepM/ murein hydrolase activator NlpD
VVIAFRAPLCPYCAGHRGIEYSIAEHTGVRAVQSGRVSFSGVVVGSRYVVVAHDDGTLATYGLLDEARVKYGDSVQVGQLVAVASGRLYFGLRVFGEYVDPQPLLAQRSPRVRLVPVDGSAARPARPGHAGQPTCRFVGETSPAPR